MSIRVRGLRALRLGAAALFGLATAVIAAPAAHATQGASAETIVLGTIQDLSGPAASYGKHALAGMQMRIDEINAADGIHGRRLAPRAEDSAYVPRQSVLAAEKLIQQERAFALFDLEDLDDRGAVCAHCLASLAHLRPAAGLDAAALQQDLAAAQVLRFAAATCGVARWQPAAARAAAIVDAGIARAARLAAHGRAIEPPA